MSRSLEIRWGGHPVSPDPAPPACGTRNLARGRDDFVDHDEVDGRERLAVLNFIAAATAD
jgi:hypothetical protein